MKNNRTSLVRRSIRVCVVAIGALLFSQPILSWANLLRQLRRKGRKMALHCVMDGTIFDFALGNWKFHLKELDHPLAGSKYLDRARRSFELSENLRWSGP